MISPPGSLKITILASGSGGNAALFESHDTTVMIDAGIGPRVLARKLSETALRAPDAIVVTHAHSDHLGDCGRISQRFKIPVFLTESTARVARHRAGDLVRVYGPREPFAIGSLTIAPTPLPHDVAQVALVVSDGKCRAAIATDLGEVPPALPEQLALCDVLLIESNHDAEMLARGPYPKRLKRRIASARGHLSNDQTHTLLCALPDTAHTVVLMHLSETNNRPEVALASARDALAGRRVRLLAAHQEKVVTLDAADRASLEPVVKDNTGQKPHGSVQLGLPFGPTAH
jgi:phosphoribosyl 1,2-cyclic phosphodiesterase